jgi:hypothetical protein
LYFAIFFSLIVEMLNMRFRKKVDHIDLNSATSEATKKGILHK